MRLVVALVLLCMPLSAHAQPYDVPSPVPQIPVSPYQPPTTCYSYTVGNTLYTQCN